jgi:hypothetical protein
MRAALLSLLVLSAPALADDAEYFPTKIGMRWTYRIAGQSDRYFVTAVKEEKFGEQICVRFESRLRSRLFLNGPAGIGMAGSLAAPIFFSEQPVGSEHAAVLRDGVHRFSFANQPIDPPICFLKSSLPKGESWKHEFKIGDVPASARYEIDFEDVTVPAGTVKGALVIRVETVDKKETTKTTVWYARGVGMIKQIIDLGEEKLMLELERVEAPKD